MDSKGNDHMGVEKLILAGLGLLAMMTLYEETLIWLESPKNRFIILVLGILILGIVIGFIFRKISQMQKDSDLEKSILGKKDGAVFCGTTDKDEDVWICPKQRSMHTQVIGTTNAGKTESVILPWAIQDIFQGRGLLLIDGKADGSLIDKLWSYTVKAGREKDFKLFSLSRQSQSFQFNPLIGGSAEEITERVFNAFEFENPHYRNLQYEVMRQVMRVFEGGKVVPTFQRLHQVISNPEILERMAAKVEDQSLYEWVCKFKGLSASERENRTSGLLTAISHFAFGAHAPLFNAHEGAITIDDALRNNQIVYFQLPVLLSPFLGRATGKLVLQSLQAAVANRHRDPRGPKKFFSVFLDDFSEYLSESFVSILNKSRSANVGIVFAHQALGDIKVLNDGIANSILTNANVKVFMRGNDPESAEYFSKVIGTKTTTKFTERQKKTGIGIDRSGDLSAREVEEFQIHPNIFKKELGVGEAVMIIPHDRGSKTVKIKFSKTDDFARPEPLPDVSKKILESIKNEPARGAVIPLEQEL